MNVPEVLAGLTGGLVSVFSILSQVYLWQRKEYRWDRMRSYLASPEWRQAFPGSLLLAYAAVLGAGIAAWMGAREISLACSWLALLALLTRHLWRTYRRGLFRPVFTLKAKLILGLAILFEGGLLLLGWQGLGLRPLVWAVVVAVLPLSTALAVAVVNIPAGIRKRQIITRARRKRAALSKLTVVGITGSYGKTSAKHFAWQLLRAVRSDVAATPRHRNSEIGVALDMLERLKPSVGVYLAEMGAYRRGEIKLLGELTRPTIGVITAIGTQHLDLFGSQEGILNAKWELIDALPGEGIAILNYDDALLRKRAQSLTVKVLWYSLTQEAEVAIREWTVGPTEITGQLHLGEFTQTIRLPLVSEAMLSSAVVAAAIAHALAVPPEKIAENLETLQPMPRTMELKKGLGESTVIDDSYSANEHGVLTAVAHLDHFSKNDKRIVLVSLIEVGAAAADIHERIGTALAKSGATVYLYGTAYEADLRRGMGDAANKLTTFTDPRELTNAAQANLTSESVVLLEGRIPELSRRAILGS